MIEGGFFVLLMYWNLQVLLIQFDVLMCSIKCAISLHTHHPQALFLQCMDTLWMCSLNARNLTFFITYNCVANWGHIGEFPKGISLQLRETQTSSPLWPLYFFFISKLWSVSDHRHKGTDGNQTILWILVYIVIVTLPNVYYTRILNIWVNLLFSPSSWIFPNERVELSGTEH